MREESNNPLSIIILAAGLGTRMKSSLAKVLHPLGGKPILGHVLEQAKALSPSQIIVVYGHDGEALQKAFSGEAFIWVERAHQQGTGDAVAKALPLIPIHHRALVLYGDVPLIQHTTLMRLITKTASNELGLLTAVMDNPVGLGRIIRNQDGQILRIVEEKDASPTQKQIQEVNTGILLAQVKALGRWIAK
jgi:bifunctional UDP-N-acetylglucosamine pyrophosphorylase/glucosamine-1-phosphate N-acetyltransferase